MKRKFTLPALSIMLALAITACGSSDTSTSTSAETSTAETVAAEEEAVATEEETTEAETTVEETTVEETEAPKEELPELQVGETVTIENVCEFTVDYADITTRVNPPSPGSYYNYYEAENGNIYVDLCIAYKNLDTENVRADKVMSATLCFDDKYTYTGFSIIEESSRSNFTYTNITSIAPLTTEYLHYLFQVPEVVNESNASIIITLTFDSEKYDFVVRDGSDASPYSASVENIKDNGEIVDGEWITVAGTCDFAVAYSDITTRVNPPSPGSYYSYYDAGDEKVYVDICIAYKNLGKENLRADKALSATLLYDGNYKYTGFSIIEESNRSNFTYTNITNISPLTTEYLHYLFEVPEEVGETDKSVVITISVGKNEYDYTVR